MTGNNVLYECVFCGKEEVHPNGVDGIRASCGGQLNAVGLTDKPVTKRSKNNGDKVIIELTNANDPPKVKLNGRTVKVVNVDLNYQTDTDEMGKHDFSMVCFDENEKHFKLCGFKR